MLRILKQTRGWILLLLALGACNMAGAQSLCDSCKAYFVPEIVMGLNPDTTPRYVVKMGLGFEVDGYRNTDPDEKGMLGIGPSMGKFYWRSASTGDTIIDTTQVLVDPKPGVYGCTFMPNIEGRGKIVYGLIGIPSVSMDVFIDTTAADTAMGAMVSIAGFRMGSTVHMFSGDADRLAFEADWNVSWSDHELENASQISGMKPGKHMLTIMHKSSGEAFSKAYFIETRLDQRLIIFAPEINWACIGIIFNGIDLSNIIFPFRPTPPSISYMWSNGSTSSAISNLSSGFYRATISADGSAVQRFGVYFPPSAYNTLVTNIVVEEPYCSSCKGRTGVIDFSIEGQNIIPYDVNFNISRIELEIYDNVSLTYVPYSALTKGKKAEFRNLKAGMYRIVVYQGECKTFTSGNITVGCVLFDLGLAVDLGSSNNKCFNYYRPYYVSTGIATLKASPALLPNEVPFNNTPATVSGNYFSSIKWEYNGVLLEQKETQLVNSDAADHLVMPAKIQIDHNKSKDTKYNFSLPNLTGQIPMTNAGLALKLPYHFSLDQLQSELSYEVRIGEGGCRIKKFFNVPLNQKYEVNITGKDGGLCYYDVSQAPVVGGVIDVTLTPDFPTGAYNYPQAITFEKFGVKPVYAFHSNIGTSPYSVYPVNNYGGMHSVVLMDNQVEHNWCISEIEDYTLEKEPNCDFEVVVDKSQVCKFVFIPKMTGLTEANLPRPVININQIGDCPITSEFDVTLASYVPSMNGKPHLQLTSDPLANQLYQVSDHTYTVPAFTGLIRLISDKGCIFFEERINTTLTPQVNVDISSKPTCNLGVGTGEISLKLSRLNTASIGNYTCYLTGSGVSQTITRINPSSPDNISFTGLAAGNYTIRIRQEDKELCDITTGVQIYYSSDNLDIIPEVLQDCEGNFTFKVEPSPKDNADNFTYAWTGGGSTTASNIIPASTTPISGYTVTVTKNGCGSKTHTFPSVLSNPFRITSLNTNPEQVCNGKLGTAYVKVTGGGQPYSYVFQKDGSTVSSSNFSIATELESGSYTVSVTSADGCTASSSFTIPEVTTIAITESASMPGCGLSVDVTGGTGPYEAVWEVLNNATPTPGIITTKFSNSPTSPVALSEVQNGKYKVYITDAFGCKSNTLTIDKTVSGESGLTSLDVFFRWRIKEKDEPLPEDVIEMKSPNPFQLAGMDIASNLNSKTSKCMDEDEARGNKEYDAKCKLPVNVDDLFKLGYDLPYYHYTLYYYDRAGNLTRTVPPNGIDLVGDRNTYNLHTYDTKYEYNGLGQVISQETPDGGKSDFIYDNLGRLWFSQNAKQALANKYSYTTYDDLGRITEVGEDDLDVAFSAKKPYPFAPSANKREITYTVYSEPGNADYYGSTQTYLRNRVSYSYTDPDGNDATLQDRNYTYYSYDPHGNVKWLVQDIAGVGRHYIGYEYDLISNKVLKVKYNEYGKDKFFHKYDYDEDNRLTQVYTSADNVTWDKDAKYDYYKHGPLKRTEIGEDKLQGLDYYYTLQGWLKGINIYDIDDNSLDPGGDGAGGTSGFPKDLFGMNLGYYNGDFVVRDYAQHTALYTGSGGAMQVANNKQLYNGNISSWAHGQYGQFGSSTPTTDKSLSTYQYDKLNRIRGSEFKSYTATLDADAYRTSYDYDGNGNIMHLNRKNVDGAAFDELEYKYIAESNKLRQVGDYADVSGYNDDIKTQPNSQNYVYDAIGNLIEDKQEDMDIEWNVYGKIKRIVKRAGASDEMILEFDYDAMGQRIKKAKKQKVSGEEDPAGWTYTYYIRDASGNIMATYDRTHATTGTSGLFAVDYRMSEQPIFGSSRLGVRKGDNLLTARMFTKTAELENIRPSYLTSVGNNYISAAYSDKRFLYIGAYDPLSGTIKPHGKPIAGTAQPLVSTAVAEGDDGVTRLYAYVNEGQSRFEMQQVNPGNLAPVANLISAQHTNAGYGTISERAKTAFVRKPGTDNDFYYIAPYTNRTNSKDITSLVYYLVEEDPATGIYSVSQTTSGQLPGSISNATGVTGKGLAVLERPASGESWVASTKIVIVTPTDVKKEVYLHRFQQGSNVPQSFKIATMKTTDMNGEDEIKFAPDGMSIYVLNDTVDMKPDFFAARVSRLSLSSDLQQLTNREDLVTDATIKRSATVWTENLLNSIEVNGDQSLLSYTYTERDPANPAQFISGTKVKDFVNGTTTTLAGTMYKVNAARNNIGDITLMLKKNATNNMYSISRSQTTGLIYHHPLVVSNALFQYGIMGINPVKLRNTLPAEMATARVVGNKEYEISDHLGNVRTTFSDKLLASLSAGPIQTIANSVDQKSNTDYYPFGMIMPGRHSENGYRFGFNGKEKDNEVKGEGNLNNFGNRIYDPRLGKWLSLDPLQAKYPSWNAYNFTMDNPILFIDPDGKIVTIKDVSSYKAVLGTLTEEEINRICINEEDGTLRITGEGLGSTNLQNLRTLVDSKTNHNFITSNTYKSLDGEVTLSEGVYGRTLFPKSEAEVVGLPKTHMSPDNDVYVILKPNTEEGLVPLVAHEGYGHAALGAKKRNGENVNPYHDYGPAREERNEDFKKQGWKAIGEAKENYKKNSKSEEWKKALEKKVLEFEEIKKKK